jgi:hypothetical protein
VPAPTYPNKPSGIVFVHVNAISGDKPLFTSGLPVEFEVNRGDRGLKTMRGSSLPLGRLGPTLQGLIEFGVRHGWVEKKLVRYHPPGQKQAEMMTGQ